MKQLVQREDGLYEIEYEVKSERKLVGRDQLSILISEMLRKNWEDYDQHQYQVLGCPIWIQIANDVVGLLSKQKNFTEELSYLIDVLREE